MAPSSYYRFPRKAPVSSWARHIDAWMRREGLSQTAAFRRLRGAFGLGEESRSAFLPYLVNKPLDEAQQAAVAAIIGWPPESPEEPPSDPAPAEAAPDLATALLALAAELAALREERSTMRRELDDLQQLVGRLAEERLSERAPEGSRAPGARPQTVG